jgi:hypothetical protein
MYPPSFVGDLHPVHPSTRLADQRGCQNGLVEDHSGGFLVEPPRSCGVHVVSRFVEVRSEDLPVADVGVVSPF